MFPYVEFSLRGLDPVGLYDVMFDIIPASNKCFKFLNNKWVPIGKKEHEFKTQPFKHPDSPRIGSEWMARKISFEKVKLSNRPGSKSGIVSTLQIHYQYTGNDESFIDFYIDIHMGSHVIIPYSFWSYFKIDVRFKMITFLHYFRFVW